jgi:tetratricopeptide (TPR) repeat protein
MSRGWRAGVHAALHALLLVALAGGLPAAASTGGEAEAAREATLQATLQAALAAARADRHAEAIEAYRRAIEAAPARRQEWLLAWADQHTWAGRLDEAATLYREALLRLDPAGRQQARIGLARALSWAERHAEALAVYDEALAAFPADREAQLGRARVLSWSDRQAEALAQYQATLRDHPGDEDALRGIGRVQSWRGRHRAAVAEMQALLQRRPHDREATGVLAESLAWMGRSDRALPVLRAQLAADPGDRQAAALLQKLSPGLQPETSLDWRDFDQSDGLRIVEQSLATRLPLADGRGHVALRYARAAFEPPATPARDLRLQRPGLEGRYRFNDAWEWNGTVWREQIDARDRGARHRLWTHDTYLTWWPGDALRLDLGSQRWTFDSEEALRKGLSATQLKLSADWLPDELTRLSLRLNRARHSDDNRREGWQLEAERRVWHTPRVHLGYRHTGYGFSLPGQGGYFNPERYRSNELTLQASGWVGDRIGWQLRWAQGREDARPGDARPIRSGSASLSWALDPALAVEAAYDYSTSRTLATGGFQRGIARLSLRYRH